MTPIQVRQFNRMRGALRRIGNDYKTTSQIHKTSDRQFGLTPEDTLEMSYENMQKEAKEAVKGVREITEFLSQSPRIHP